MTTTKNTDTQVAAEAPHQAEAAQQAAEQQQQQDQKVTYSVSPSLLNILNAIDASIAFTSYQSGRLYLLGRNPKGGVMIHERFFQKAMGLHVKGETMLLASLFQIMRFENTLRPGEAINHQYDACYVPRVTHSTGILDAHDVGLANDGSVIFINTRFNCIAKPSTKHSFEVLWKPSFISKIVDEDRCHLNGLAMEDGEPRYVTAVSKSDTVDGWRDRRDNGGIIIDVKTNKIVCEGLSMPHSPRMHNGKLYVLNSGTGEFGWVEPGSGRKKGVFHPIVFCPGFVRGLAFHENYAFVGLSRPRYERFEGLALDQKLKDADSEPWTGVQIIDMKKKSVVGWFRIDGAVQEMFDVALIPRVKCPMSVGFGSGEIRTLVTYAEAPEPEPEAQTTT